MSAARKQDADPAAMAPFLDLLTRGFYPLVIYPKGARMPGKDHPATGKEPIGKAWGAERWTPERASDAYRSHPAAGLGICLGPGRGPGGTWLIDLEGDGPEAEASRLLLFGGELVETVGWRSTRGQHQVFAANVDRLAAIMPGLAHLDLKIPGQPGVFKSIELPGLEMRLGGLKPDRTAKQIQSVVPPTQGTDGTPRSWTGGLTVAAAPEAFYEVLGRLAAKPDPKVKASAKGPGFAGQAKVPPSAESRAIAYVKSCQGAISGEYGHNQTFKVCIAVGPGFNLTEDQTFRIVWEHWNPLCDPQWSEAELRRKVSEAFKSESKRGFKLDPERDRSRERSSSSNPRGERLGPKGVYQPGDESDHEGRSDRQPDPERETILCGSEEAHEGLKTWTPLAIAALKKANGESPVVFQRMKKLARLSMPAEDDEPPTIENFDVDSLKGRLDRVANWGNVEITRKGPSVRYGPPRLDIVRDILSMGTPDSSAFPPLESVVESPLFGADGRLIMEPGYHRDAKLYYSPRAELQGITIPGKPTEGDVEAAVELIFGDLLADFPFANPASKANALAVMLLPFVRLLITGPTPNHHFTASTEGTGKGMCAAACAYPFLGREIDINPQKESEAEWRKAMTSFLMSGGSHYFVDNLRNPLGWDDVELDVESGVLCAAWTGGQWRDRILGGQTEARVKLHAVFMSSGNNVSFSRELTRRIVPIELETPCENPSTRTGFKHDPLLEWAKSNRPALLRACLVICKYWILKGRKPAPIAYGSYESYAKTMGGILEAAGVSGFLANLPGLTGRKDRESIRWPALVEAWHAAFGHGATTTGMLYEMIFGKEATKNEKASDGIPDLQVAFADIAGEGSVLGKKQKFGRALVGQDGRIWAGFRIVRTSTMARNGSPFLRLELPQKADDTWPGDRE